MKEISIVIPTFNEQDNILPLYKSITNEIKNLNNYKFSLIFIDNASEDLTQDRLSEIALIDNSVKVIFNCRNYGYIRSSYHALLQVESDAAILMSADFQDPPSLITRFVEKYELGYKTILAVKPESDENFFLFTLRKIFYRFINKISETPLINNATGSGLYSREVIHALREINDPYPYFRGLVCELGIGVTTVPFRQPKRSKGISSQNFYTLFDMGILGIVKHSRVPLRIFTLCGLAISFLSFIVAIIYFILKLLFWDTFIMGVAPLVIGLFLFCGLQFIFLGLIGEYVLSIHVHVRNLPHVIERNRINF